MEGSSRQLRACWQDAGAPACSPEMRAGKYFSSCALLPLRTSWLTHRLLWAPYDSATEPLARLSS